MLTALVVGLAPSGAEAQDERARARQLYGEAQALFDRGQYPQAEAQFRAAYAAVPNPVVLKAVAASEERQGNISGAVTTLQQYLAESPNAPDRAEIEARIRELTGRPATMTFNTTPPGAQIILDGRDSGQRTPATLQLPAGDHTLELQLDGYHTHHQPFAAQAATRSRLDITMTPGVGDDTFGAATGDGQAAAGATTGGGGGSADPSVGVWVTAGIAALGLVSGTVFGFLALSEQSNFDATPSNEIADRGETFALVADISFGVAAAAAITAIVLYIVERTSAPSDTALLEDDELRLDLGGWADANGGGASAQISF